MFWHTACVYIVATWCWVSVLRLPDTLFADLFLLPWEIWVGVAMWFGCRFARKKDSEVHARFDCKSVYVRVVLGGFRMNFGGNASCHRRFCVSQLIPTN